MAIETNIPHLSREQNQDDLRTATPALEESNLFDFIVFVVEGKLTILMFFLCFAVVGVVTSLLLPAKYIATVTILPPQQNSSLSSAFASQMDNLGPLGALAGGGLGLKNTNEMYVSMLKSKVVENAIIQRFDLMNVYHRKYLSDTRKTLEHWTTTEAGLKDGLIHLSFEDKSQQRAAEIATAYVDQLRDLSQHLAISDASHRRLLYERQLDQTKNDLVDAEEALEREQKHSGLIQPDSQAKALIESGAILRGQVSAKEVQIEGMRTYATGENSAIAQAEQELAGMRAQLAELGGSKGQGTDDLIVPKGQIPAAGLEYLRKMRDVRYYEAKYSLMARQLEMAKLDEARQGAMIQIVDPALPPDKRSSPRRQLIVIFFSLAGLMVGLFYVLLRAGIERANRDVVARIRIDRLKSALSIKRRRRTE